MQERAPRTRRRTRRVSDRRESSLSSGGPLYPRGGTRAPVAPVTPEPPRQRTVRMVSEAERPQPQRDDWATVVRRNKGRGRVRLVTQSGTHEPRGGGEERRGPAGAGDDVRRDPQRRATTVKRQRAPRTAAVSIVGDHKKEGFSYGDILRKARQSIALNDLGIDQTRIRFGATGGMLIEVHGPENKAKADRLAARLREVIPEGAKISRPMKMGEIKILGLDDSTTPQDIVEVVARMGECDACDVKPGAIQPLRNGLGLVWVRCPMAAAIRVAECGRIRVGWTSARVELLDAKPLQCFRCLEFGHAKQYCRNPVDRSLLCYKCGREGHVAMRCDATPRCVVCADAGLTASHRLGSGECHTMLRQRGRGVERRSTPGLAGAPVDTR